MRPNGKRVLLIDDDQDMRSLVADVLRSQGFGVAVCENAEGALALLERIPTPDALLVDLRMPDMSGWEFIDELRSDERHRQVPVIILSGLVTSDIARKLKAAAFVKKPFLVTELADTIQRACTPAA